MPGGRSLKLVGGVAGSRTQRVSLTPVPTSVALTVGLTGKMYQQHESGVAGSSTIVVTGGAPSELNGSHRPSCAGEVVSPLLGALYEYGPRTGRGAEVPR